MPKKFENQYRIQTNRLQDYDYGAHGRYFIEISTKNQTNYFGEVTAKPRNGAALQPTPIALAAGQYWSEIPKHYPFVELDDFTITPNSILGILFFNRPFKPDWSPNQFGPQSQNLGAVIRGFKSTLKRFANQSNIAFEWQSRYYDHIIRDDADYAFHKRKIREALDSWKAGNEIKALATVEPRNCAALPPTFNINEKFLHYIWQYGLFSNSDLKTKNGEPIQILSRGLQNLASGADFSMSKLKIGDTIWAGNTEIQVLSSDWFLHGHQHDLSHRNTILHVVWQDDGGGPSDIPCIELHGRVARHVLDRFERLSGNRRWIACEDYTEELVHPSNIHWIERMAIERLESRYGQTTEMAKNAKGDMEYVLHLLIFRAYGFKVNAQPMEQLLQGIGMKLLGKIFQSEQARQAIFFGIAGMLSGTFQDEYPRALAAEFDYQRKKHDLSVLPLQWKTGGIRPPNFPWIRLAQLAAMKNLGPGLLSAVRDSQNIEELKKLFAGSPHPYWQNHYAFDREGASKSRLTGEGSINLLLINAVVPVLFYLSKIEDNTQLAERAIDILANLPPEAHRITRQWNKLGVKAENALHTQGILHLYREYCTPLRCLQCGIANKILTKV